MVEIQDQALRSTDTVHPNLPKTCMFKVSNDRATSKIGARKHPASQSMAANGSAEDVRVLLKHGANVDAEDKKGRTSFQIASVKGYNDIVELLSDHDAKGVFSIITSSLCLPW
ncbi:hypothetical protein V8E52_003986 [Russula decolorans]